jgi:hypothetical protein
MDPRIEREAEIIQPKEEKPLKHARSKAELIRTRNSNIMLFFATTQASCTILILLKTFGII